MLQWSYRSRISYNGKFWNYFEEEFKYGKQWCRYSSTSNHNWEQNLHCWMKQSLNKIFMWLFRSTTAILAFLVLVVKQSPRFLDGMPAKRFQLCVELKSSQQAALSGSNFYAACQWISAVEMMQESSQFQLGSCNLPKVFYAWRGNSSW